MRLPNITLCSEKALASSTSFDDCDSSSIRSTSRMIFVLLARDRQPVAAETQLAARAAVDVGDGLAAAVEVEPQPLARRDADMAPVGAADRRMMRVHRQIGDVDRVAELSRPSVIVSPGNG